MADKIKKLNGISRELMALRVASELEDGTYVNLGIGIPTLVSDWIEGRDIVLQAEIGMLNTGPLASPDKVDQDLINASCQAVIELPGTCYFSDCESMAMIRGGYMDVAVLGALQVSEKGDIAGWNNPTRRLPPHLGNIGGSMDLAVGARKVIAVLMHTDNDREPKILKKCTYPLTATGVVKLIVTDLAVIEVTPEGLLLREVAPGITTEDVQSVTEPRLIISPNLREMAL
ncbi:MAG: 3-oxoacid CoA-transferase subunit B [Dehalococcoidales bacterium]|nr:3-oxoacid CoA-transferase subunit B [Dehalococcoidales bacterium]